MPTYRRFKYVIGELDNAPLNLLCAVVFPETVEHQVLGKTFLQVYSGGFGTIDPLTCEVTLSGESVGLNVKSQPADMRLVRQALGLTQS